ncbi:hypothetical protein ElyMa_002531800 [Elysia marginata]|uniref:Reverse transcriptase domain-containing protein n=1 Tax=Elysia marginata TaxID=1093978 RepID=A0AAV4GTY4_9GAST|nr:hypothetical protein ElyMa_002531800 [Elysia marginata]
MQEKTSCVETTARSSGLKISHSKSKVMKINTTLNSDVRVDGKSVENVTDFKYIGSYLTVDSKRNREISARIVMASIAFYKLNNIILEVEKEYERHKVEIVHISCTICFTVSLRDTKN